MQAYLTCSEVALIILHWLKKEAAVAELVHALTDAARKLFSINISKINSITKCHCCYGFEKDYTTSKQHL